MKRIFSPYALLAPLAVVLAIAGCGGGSHQPPYHPRPLAQVCPPGRSQMGCSARVRVGLPGVKKLAPGVPAPRGALFPDVSVWQGAVDWNAVASWQRSHGWRPAGIFKLGEHYPDTQAPRNAAETARLGFWRAGYWFARNWSSRGWGTCNSEAAAIVWAAKRYGLRVVALDLEVPEDAGLAPCLAGPVRAAGFIVVIYSAPGTWPGGSSAGLSVWVASYGPSHPPCLFVCVVGDLSHQSVLAWQFTDGAFGASTDIPGIGRDDVSVDYGIERLGAAPPPPPRLRCFGRHAQLGNATCKRVRPQVASWSRARDASRRAYDARSCPAIRGRLDFFRARLNRPPSGALHTRHVGGYRTSRAAYARRHCGTFDGRAVRYDRLVHEALARY